MGIGKCFGKFIADCGAGCASVTEKYEDDAELTEQFVCTKITQAWLEDARAKMEYKRNRRLCPHCKLELPMLPRPMYAQRHMETLWKIGTDEIKHKQEKKIGTDDIKHKQEKVIPNYWSNVDATEHINHYSFRSTPFSQKTKSPIYYYKELPKKSKRSKFSEKC